MRKFVLCALGIVLAGSGCLARAADVRLADPAAKKLYTAKCAKCHKPYDPNAYSGADWDKWMDRMSRKAKLKPDQKQVISDYVQGELRQPRPVNSRR